MRPARNMRPASAARARCSSLFHRRSCRSTGGIGTSMTSERYTPNWTPGVQITSKSSSPWSSATMVGRWQGAASRSLIMHSDPLAAYAYRWLDGVASRETIDRCFGWFWNHLRGLGRMHDMVVCSNSQLAERLRSGGLGNTETLPMGVEPGIFSPKHRSATLREGALERLGLDRDGVLLIGVGRFSAEKRWDMVMRAVAECARTRAVALLLVGDGRKRQALELLADQLPNVAVIPKVTDRHELARLMASADALIHGCEAETFCMVAAEARASGIPLIVPDRGAATDQLVRGAGAIYRSANERSLERAIERFIDRGPELQRAAAARASRRPHHGRAFRRTVRALRPARLRTHLSGADSALARPDAGRRPRALRSAQFLRRLNLRRMAEFGGYQLGGKSWRPVVRLCRTF